MITQEHPTLGAFLDFVLDNKKNKVFRGMSINQIMGELKEASDNHTLVYHQEKDLGITGVAILIVDHKAKTCFVKRALCITPNASIALCCIYDTIYVGYRLARNKHDIYKEYSNPIALVTRWAKQSAFHLKLQLT